MNLDPVPRFRSEPNPDRIHAAISRHGTAHVITISPCQTDAWCLHQARGLALFAAEYGLEGLQTEIHAQILGYRQSAALNGGFLLSMTSTIDAGHLVWHIDWNHRAPAVLLAILDDGTHVPRAYPSTDALHAACDGLAAGRIPGDWPGPVDARTRWIAWTPYTGTCDAVPTGDIFDYRARAASDG